MADWNDIPGDSKEKYGLYLCSREWAELKRAVHERAGGLCERCRRNPIEAVHHLTYDRKYAENLEDLQANCRGCHEFTHGKSDDDPVVQFPPAKAECFHSEIGMIHDGVRVGHYFDTFEERSSFTLSHMPGAQHANVQVNFRQPKNPDKSGDCCFNLHYSDCASLGEWLLRFAAYKRREEEEIDRQMRG